jgi:hypothetical protein
LIRARSARLTTGRTGSGVSRRTMPDTASPAAVSCRAISHAVRPPLENLPPENPPMSHGPCGCTARISAIMSAAASSSVACGASPPGRPRACSP